MSSEVIEKVEINLNWEIFMIKVHADH